MPRHLNFLDEIGGVKSLCHLVNRRIHQKSFFTLVRFNILILDTLLGSKSLMHEFFLMLFWHAHHILSSLGCVSDSVLYWLWWPAMLVEGFWKVGKWFEIESQRTQVSLVRNVLEGMPGMPDMAGMLCWYECTLSTDRTGISLSARLITSISSSVCDIPCTGKASL